jgi:hypothetical protein
VIGSPDDTENGISESGSVRLVNGTTGIQAGMQVGNSLVGMTAADSMGFDGTTALVNSNYVTATRREDVNGQVNAGSVRLMNGTTATQIGNPVVGNSADDINGAVVARSLNADFFVLGLGLADNFGGVDSGLVQLIAQ